jgi:hypothetical protein
MLGNRFYTPPAELVAEAETESGTAPGAATTEAAEEQQASTNDPIFADDVPLVQPAAVAVDPAQALVFTRVTNARGSLTKTFTTNKADPDSAPEKATDANVYEGHASRLTCADLYAFRDALAAVSAADAFTYGVTDYDEVRIVTKDRVARVPGAVARGRDHFHFRSGPGVWMLDYDAGYLPVDYETADALRDALVSALPALACAPMLWTASASTFIFNAETGRMVKGAGGARIYIPVDDASDVVRAHKALREYLWAAGIGAYSVSKSGQLIERTLIDLKTAQPERLDFVAGAHCVPPLEQRRPPAQVFEADVLGGVEPAALKLVVPDPERSIREAAEEARAAAKAAIEPERTRARELYKQDRVSNLVARGVPAERAEEVVDQALARDFLFAEFELRAEDGSKVTVAELLDDPKRWHGKRFADPLEPDYGNDPRIAYANLRSGGRPTIYSHAHGGKRYTLFRQPAVLSVSGGDAPRLADACLDLLRVQQEVFDGPAGGMVRVASDGRTYPVTLPWLQDHLGAIAAFQRFDRRSKGFNPIDVPAVVPSSILAREGQRELAKLNAVVTAPVLRADGSVLDVPGYDPASGILYDSSALDAPRVNAAPDLDQVLQALRELHEPIAQFPYDSPASRAVAIAAMLTSCVRRGLPTAPAFIFDAPSAGTGKTLLAECVARLGGHNIDVVKWPGSNEEETTKLVMAALRDGKTCLTFDNVVGRFGNAATDLVLTSPHVSGRVLGVSETHTVVNRCMILATGNNVTTQGDTNRRVLRCRIDARVERPYHRAFAFNPAQMIDARRLQFVAAALTILRGYIVSGQRRTGKLASFEAWDGLVRNAVVWLGGVQDCVPLADPVQTIDDAEDADSAKGALHTFLALWHQRFGPQAMTAGAVLAHANAMLMDDDADAQRLAFRGALVEVVRGDSRKSGDISNAEFGQWLSTQKDVTLGDYHVEPHVDRKRKVTLWSVVRSAA